MNLYIINIILGEEGERKGRGRGGEGRGGEGREGKGREGEGRGGEEKWSGGLGA